MFYEVSASVVNEYHESGDFDGFQLELFRRLSCESPVNAENFKNIKTEELIEQVYDSALASYERHGKVTADQAMPVITDVFLNQGQQYQNIVVPITDGMKTMQVVTDLAKTYKSQGRELIASVEKYITLAIIDNEWKEHLREMDELRRSVQNASIEQKDPLLIYKLESFNLFKAMLERINGDVVGFLAKAGLPTAQPQVREAQAPAPPQQRVQTSRTEVPQFAGSGSSGAPRPSAGPAAPGRGAMPPPPPRTPPTPVRVDKAPGRNDPCPCGSGKKYKQCHGQGA